MGLLDDAMSDPHLRAASFHAAARYAADVVAEEIERKPDITTAELLDKLTRSAELAAEAHRALRD